MLNVRLLASASVPDRVMVFEAFFEAETDCAFATGIVLTLTVATALSTVPSFTLNVKLSGPVALVGVYVTTAVHVEVPVPSTVHVGDPMGPSVPFVGDVTILKVSGL